MTDTYWAEREGARWDIYGKQRGWMAQADTEDDARLIVAALMAKQSQQPTPPPAGLSAVPEGYALVPESYLSDVSDMVSWLQAWRRASLEAGKLAADASDAIDAMLAAANKENTND